MINVKGYLQLLHEYDYALTKIDVPYMPVDFPHTYPIGKDMDMYVSAKDDEIVKSITHVFIRENKYDSLFELKIVQGTDNIRFRFENHGKLHYQIDITIDRCGLVENKVTTDNYHMLSLENEMIIRKQEVLKNPHKKHHVEWLNRIKKQDK
jgi:hypothetical protein